MALPPISRQRRSGCPISIALELLGDAWSLLIVRDLMFKQRSTFKDFLEAEEGIASNILTHRLGHLVELGILELFPNGKLFDTARALFEAYRAVNQRFADAVVAEARSAWPEHVVSDVLLARVEQTAPGLAPRFSAVVDAYLAIEPRFFEIARYGVVAGAVCALAIELKFKLGFDDSLDVVGVHLVGGLWGTLAVGLFASASTTAGIDGLLYGGGLDQLRGAIPEDGHHARAPRLDEVRGWIEDDLKEHCAGMEPR